MNLYNQISLGLDEKLLQARLRSLHFAGTNRLLVKRSTVGSRAFPVAGPKTWNALPEDVTSFHSE